MARLPAIPNYNRDRTVFRYWGIHLFIGIPAALRSTRFLERPKRPAYVMLLALSATLVGCSTSGYPLDGSAATVTYSGLTGNWELTAAATSGTLPFTAFRGYFREQAGDSSQSLLTTAALQAAPASDCYKGATLVPLQGATQSGSVALHSFSVNGQYLNLAATEDSTITHLAGTFSVTGGCANGTAGTFTGVRYATVAGIYAGSLNGTAGVQAVQFTLQQQIQGTGDGLFLVTGSASVSGNSCFTSGTLSSSGSDANVSGSQFALNLDTNDASGAKLLVRGTLDPLAQVLTVTSATVTSGACVGTLGTGTLNINK